MAEFNRNTQQPPLTPLPLSRCCGGYFREQRLFSRVRENFVLFHPLRVDVERECLAERPPCGVKARPFGRYAACDAGGRPAYRPSVIHIRRVFDETAEIQP